MSTAVRNPSTGELDAGDWWVTIENTAGSMSVTNVVTVASNNVAIMSDFSIEDNYETLVAGFTATSTQLTDTPDEQIINVTFNKKYSGDLYVNAVDNETYTAAKMIGGAAISLPGALTEVNKAKDLTNKNALTDGTGIFYAESDGTVHAKIVAPAALTRGTEYELIFDQDDIVGDELGSKATKADLNVSNSFESPYVVAPAEIVVTSYSTGNTTPKVTMYDEDGAVLEWWDDVDDAAATTTGFDSMKFYSIDSNTAGDSDTAATTSNVAIAEGVVTLTIDAAANDYGYAKFTTTKGIFAAKSATLTSEVFEGAMAPMTNMTLAQDSSDPKAAKVSFKNLKGVASGNVYIFQAANGTDTIAAIAGYDKKKAVGTATVAGGTTSVVIDDVFEAVNTTDAYKNDFLAVYVPDDTDLFKTVYNGDGNATIAAPAIFTLAQKLTKYALVGDDAAATVVSSKYKFTATDTYGAGADGSGDVAYLEALDQFGNVIALDGTGSTNVIQTAATLEAVKSSFNGDPTYDPATTATDAITVETVDGTAGDKAAAIVFDDTALGGQITLAAGNKLSATLRTGQTLTLECKTADAGGEIVFGLSLS